MPVGITAKDAKRLSSSWNRTVSEEIAVIDIYVAAASEDGNLTATIGATTSVVINSTTVAGTRMTADTATGEAYYNTWQGYITDPAKSAEMSAVIKHFEDLGYSIARRSSDSTLFYWYLTWY